MFKYIGALKPRLGWWFGLAEPVDRRQYLGVGAGLMTLKYLVEAAVFRALGGSWMGPLQFFNPLLSSHARTLDHYPGQWFLAYGLWNLPFIWIGISLSCRRAFNAGWSPLVGLWFLVPGINYILMVILAAVPTRRLAGQDPGDLPMRTGRRSEPWETLPFRAMAAATVPGLMMGVAGMTIFVLVLDSYGAGLFVGLPILMGVCTGYQLNRGQIRSARATVSAALALVLVAEGMLLVFALEGILCLAMALPILAVLASLGAAVGRWVAILGTRTPAGLAAVILLAPGYEAVERFLLPDRIAVVESRVEIAATPDRVWRNVVSFANLPEPNEWYFKAGIAYPIRAVIDGSGVGAVRRCQFSTGDFVEPITAWEPGRKLSFGVRYQPAPMKELSPYEAVYAPHLDGYWQSTAGEFRLVDLGNGRTRLEGSTWYRMRIQPAGYWDIWAQAIVHRIHLRVLRHIKTQTEAGR